MLLLKNTKQEILEKDKELLKKLNKGKTLTTFDNLPTLTHYNAVIVLENGTKEKRRFIKEDEKNLFVYGKGMKRYGYRLYKSRGLTIDDKTIKGFIIDKPAEKYLRDFIKYRDYFLKNAASGLWNDFRKIMIESASADIEGFLNDKEITSTSIAWEKSLQYGLFQFSKYKTTSLKSCGFSDTVIEKIKEAINRKENFHFLLIRGYNYFVDGKNYEDGDYKAWLLEEGKNNGATHEYILINYNNALFVEDD